MKDETEIKQEILNLASTKPELLIDLLKLSPQEIQHAVIVNLSRKVTMLGETIFDKVTKKSLNGESRFSVQVHPYPWTASGSSVVVIYYNIFGSAFVALVYNQRRDNRPQHQRQQPNDWKLPEGFMHPLFCAGGEKGLSRLPSEYQDEAEELILKGKSADEAYAEIKKKYHLQINNDSPNHSSSYDKNLKETAQRELEEEIGLKMTNIDLIDFSQRSSKYAMLHAKYRAEINKSKYSLKTVTEVNIPPNLTVDNVEIGAAIWAKVSSMKFKITEGRIQVFKNDIEIQLYYSVIIGKALRDSWNEKIKYSNGVYEKRENVCAKLQMLINKHNKSHSEKFSLKAILGPSPEESLISLGVDVNTLPGENSLEKQENLTALAMLGEYGESYYEKLIEIAKHIDKPDIDLQQCKNLADQGPEIVKNLIASAVGKYSLWTKPPQNMPSEDDEDYVKIDAFQF